MFNNVGVRLYYRTVVLLYHFIVISYFLFSILLESSFKYNFNIVSLILSQIRDWLTVEEEMLRQQAVVVGDVDEILHLLDKQKVSRLSMISR